MPPVDYKKKYKDIYRPKINPSIIDMPPINYVAIEGFGDPNDKNGSYHNALMALYGISYTIKMNGKTCGGIEGYFEYVVPPLEGLWYNEGGKENGGKDGFHWISMIRLPEFADEKVLEWAKELSAVKKHIDTSSAKFITLHEGLCVQSMHIGGFDKERETVARMDSFIADNYYENDLTDKRLHHEVYLSDPKKTPEERMKTIIRHPIKPANT
ncbi:MAG: GyrI-like domain-containing protein [Huintestinicola sp.]